MYHSVTFGSKNSWDDWHLIPSSRPRIVMPAVKSKWIEIPGVDGQVDMYKHLYGVPMYKNRQGNIEFIIADYGMGTWSDLYADMAACLHGQPMTLILEDDPGFYYEGVMTLGELKPGANYSGITIDYNLRPFKYAIDEDFPAWNPMDYDLNRGRAIRNVKVNGEKIITLDVPRRKVVPDFYTTAQGMTVTVGEKTYPLYNGMTHHSGLVLDKGPVSLTVNGHGRVAIDCRGGVL